jgi:pimeloyl-ACP methyl ester carboxylesterase
MTEITHHTINANGLRIHYAEAGAGPLVVLCHGFPELWFSWRHQLSALAEAGFRAVAPDMRGYGQTEAPHAVDQYTMLHLVGDIVGLVEALGGGGAVIAGHDWGAPVAWNCALLRPDLFRAVIALSVPFRPRSPVRPTSAMPQTDDAMFYQLYFQEEGRAEADYERDPAESLRKLLYYASGDAPPRPAGAPIGMVSRRGGGLTGALPAPTTLPPWLSEADVAYFVSEFSRTGFRGGLNWYRNIDRNWEQSAAFAGLKVKIPALYIVGDRDLVVAAADVDKLIANLALLVPGLRKTVILPGCGHWTQQERAPEVNAAMIAFLRSLN